MTEYREICEGNGGNTRLRLQPRVSWCDRDPPHHKRRAGAPRHPQLENEPQCKKSRERVQQRALIR